MPKRNKYTNSERLKIPMQNWLLLTGEESTCIGMHFRPGLSTSKIQGWVPPVLYHWLSFIMDWAHYCDCQPAVRGCNKLGGENGNSHVSEAATDSRWSQRAGNLSRSDAQKRSQVIYKCAFLVNLRCLQCSQCSWCLQCFKCVSRPVSAWNGDPPIWGPPSPYP